MRILQISSARSIGGGERHVADLSNELSKRGHDLFAAVVHGSPLPRLLTGLPSGNIAQVGLRNAMDAPSALRIARFVRRKNVQIIHAHLAKDYPVAAAAARMARASLVITRHVLFPMNPLHRLLLRGVKMVIAPSSAVARSLQDQRIFPSQKIVTIRHGLDIDKFPVRASRQGDRLCVGSVGNLDPVKGFDILIRAAAIVSKKLPSVKFKIVGEDRSPDNRNEVALRRLIDLEGVQDMVQLAGWANNISDAFSEFDVFVSASRSESFGFVIAEAMLSGLPVVATQTEGAKEIISDPSLGRLVPVAAVEDLAEAVIGVLEDASLRRELARFGRNHIADNFSLERMVDETERVYGSII
jgi:L-malate glycosyltransferase